MKKNLLLFSLLLLQLVVYGGKKDSKVSLQERPYAFRENKGQVRDQNGNAREDIDFLLNAPELSLYVGKGKLQYQMQQQEEPMAPIAPGTKRTYQARGSTVTISRMEVTLIGANPNATIIREGVQKDEGNYYYASPKGNVEVSGVKSYQKIIYRNIYPAIDWVLYTNGNNLKYDFIVHPGGKVSDIKLQYSGAESLQLEQDGSLVITTQAGKIKENKPYSYIQGSSKAVPSKFLLRDDVLSFETGKSNGTLVIDPGVEWATYFGGSLLENSMGITTDSLGFIYVAGTTKSLSNIATSGAYQTTFAGGISDFFIAKLDSLGQLHWATYYGGSTTAEANSGNEFQVAISCDQTGNVYLAGATFSDNGIATTGSFQSIKDPAGPLSCPGFVAKFSTSGARLWGTYYHAPSTISVINPFTRLNAIACDKFGNVYAGGLTNANNGTLATAGSHQPVFEGTSGTNSIIVKFDGDGNRLWASFYGMGTVNDIKCDEDGNLYFTGSTSSMGGIATQGTFIPAQIPQNSSGFLAKMNSNGSRQWGTYLASPGLRIAVDNNHHYLYVTGTTGSPTNTLISTPNAHQQSSVASTTPFLIQFDQLTGNRNWGTYYGGEKASNNAYATCDLDGNVYFAGTTTSRVLSQNIATEGSQQDTLNTDAPVTATNQLSDAYLVQFDSTGKRLWGSYYGGLAADGGTAITCDPYGAVYLLGNTSSDASISTLGSYQQGRSGEQDAFIVRWVPVDMALANLVAPSNDTVCAGSVPIGVTLENRGRLALQDTLFISYSFTGPTSGVKDTFYTGTLVVGATAVCELGEMEFPVSGSYTFTVFLHHNRYNDDKSNDTLTFEITATSDLPQADIVVGQIGAEFYFSNANAQPGDTYSWDFGDGTTSTLTEPQHEYSATDSFTVTLIVTNYCGTDTATIRVLGIGDNPNGITDPEWATAIGLYPNPASSVITLLQKGNNKIYAYSIYNTLGQEALAGSSENKAINLSLLPSGNYYITIRTDKGVVVKKFQIQRP